jgi:hypothetical protein
MTTAPYIALEQLLYELIILSLRNMAPKRHVLPHFAVIDRFEDGCRDRSRNKHQLAEHAHVCQNVIRPEKVCRAPSLY